ncbi:MAG TPA: hypothetical protein VIM56_10540 [Rhizomicrobium sp.]
MPDSKASKTCQTGKDTAQIVSAVQRIKNQKVRYFLAMLAEVIAEEFGGLSSK